MKNRNSSLRIAAAALVLLAAALLLFRLAIYQHPTAAPVARPVQTAVAPAPPPEAVVLSVKGDVQRSRGGEWTALAAGERLGRDAEVRTGKGASTDLRLGARDQVTLTESSDLVIQDLTQEVRRLRLLRGRVSVDEQDLDAPPLRIEDGSGAVAEGRRARFSVLSNGTAIAVATEKGEVSLTSGTQTVAVAAGMQSVAYRGRAPAVPRAIPTKVLLQVANAVIGASAETCAELDGTVPAGAELEVDGVVTALDEQGRFHLKVPRARGKRTVLVTLRDASGRSKTREVPCAPSPAEVHDVAIKWRDIP